ncbi:MAG: hypothetical protein JZD41_00300, partial [Thermoproteus sp.]|nr:hypothetical protein [Thermoproteus sp.]
FVSGGTTTNYTQVLAVCNWAPFTLSIQLVAVGVVSAQNANLINQLTLYQYGNPSNAVSFSGTSTTSASTSPIPLGPGGCAYFGVYVSAAPVSAAAQGPTYQVDVIATAPGLALTNVVYITPYVSTQISNGTTYGDAYWMSNGTLYLTQPAAGQNGGVYVQFNWPSGALGLLVNVTFGYTTGTSPPADGVIITAFAGSGSWCTPAQSGYLPYGSNDAVPCGTPFQWFAQFNPWGRGLGDGVFMVAVFNNKSGQGNGAVSSGLGWSFSPNTYMVASAYYNATANELYLYWYNPLNGTATAYAYLPDICSKWQTPEPGNYILAIAGATRSHYADWRAYCISYTVVTSPSQIPWWAQTTANYTLTARSQRCA